MRKGRLEKDLSALFLPDDPDLAAKARKAWAWKQEWRKRMAALPFEQKLNILWSMMEGARMHPRVLEEQSHSKGQE